MSRKTAKDFPQELLTLFDGYVHGGMDRRNFLQRAEKFAVGGLSAAMLLDMLKPDYALANQVSADDKRVAAQYVSFASPQGYGRVRGYLAGPADAQRSPAVVVIHENRGLNPYIEDVARRLAVAGYVALAPDALTSLGGYPGDDEKGLAMFGSLDRGRMAQDFLAAAHWVKERPDGAGTLSGVSVDIAHELGRRLGVPVEPLPFEAAGKVSAAASRGAWDVAFLAVDPERAKEISFSNPYVVIEGAYLVRSASPLQTVASVDGEGTRVVVARGSAYDLFLSQALQHATLKRATSTPDAVNLFLTQHLDVLAGVRQALEQTASANPGLRLIPGRFMEIKQAMGVPAGRAAGASYVAAFVEDIKRSGFAAAALAKSGQTDAAVAPPG